jgi:hypothetical protein
MFSTDNRDKAGESGTSRLRVHATVSDEFIGNMEGQPESWSEAHDDPSNRISVGTILLPDGQRMYGYIEGSLRTKSAIPTKSEKATDIIKCSAGSSGPCMSSLKIEASAAYPFLWVAPNIDFTVTLTLYKCRGKVWYKIHGSHNEFPAYEAIVNGKLDYSDYPPENAGPGAVNLNWRKDFVVDWQERK